eukprot:CAMPEP_0178679004 /NCGR_PEP_ID=MMETSP0698-20121128/37252_1 /TAXON_ID=265572 /ORGANISM="Extubocellulus spinifer, Strain CCMP396" /LENGTH=406 /DNA_ID=CAMNT_0020323349 /DNA_START=130 /DNA_END=1351 /DNA_ORIENTATION=-
MPGLRAAAQSGATPGKNSWYRRRGRLEDGDSARNASAAAEENDESTAAATILFSLVATKVFQNGCMSIQCLGRMEQVTKSFSIEDWAWLELCKKRFPGTAPMPQLKGLSGRELCRFSLKRRSPEVASGPPPKPGMVFCGHLFFKGQPTVVGPIALEGSGFLETGKISLDLRSENPACPPVVLGKTECLFRGECTCGQNCFWDLAESVEEVKVHLNLARERGYRYVNIANVDQTFFRGLSMGLPLSDQLDEERNLGAAGRADVDIARAAQAEIIKETLDLSSSEDGEPGRYCREGERIMLRSAIVSSEHCSPSLAFSRTTAGFIIPRCVDNAPIDIRITLQVDVIPPGDNYGIVAMGISLDYHARRWVSLGRDWGLQRSRITLRDVLEELQNNTWRKKKEDEAEGHE